ncbi:MAG TPA: VacJ family lipoprotein [Gammaproteobacteria bacterium]|nr:VacJ family lipoprotein [Gammaproteobacteria bacterium]
MSHNIKHIIAILLVLCSTSLRAECKYVPEDPYVEVNRVSFYFNHMLFALYIKPATKLYDLLPLPAKEGANNFIQNIRMACYTANSVLQGKFTQAGKGVLRFAVNSTLGIAGLFDVAAEIGLPEKIETMGNTFYKWGWKESSYLVIPLIGPSTIRDGIGIAGDYFINPSAYFPPEYWNPYYVLVLINTNYRAKQIQDLVSIAGVNDYDFVRSSFLQHRHYELTGEALSPESSYANDGKDLAGPPD